MNYTNQILKYLPDPYTMKENLGAAVDNLQEQAPLLAKEIINWRIWTMGMGSASTLLLCIILAILSVWCAKLYKKKNDICCEDGYQVLAVLSGAGSIISVLSSIAFFIFAMQPVIAPRMYIITYITNLIK